MVTVSGAHFNSFPYRERRSGKRLASCDLHSCLKFGQYPTRPLCRRPAKCPPHRNSWLRFGHDAVGPADRRDLLKRKPVATRPGSGDCLFVLPPSRSRCGRWAETWRPRSSRPAWRPEHVPFVQGTTRFVAINAVVAPHSREEGVDSRHTGKANCHPTRGARHRPCLRVSVVRWRSWRAA